MYAQMWEMKLKFHQGELQVESLKVNVFDDWTFLWSPQILYLSFPRMKNSETLK